MNSSSAARARSRSQRRSGASTPAPLALHPVRAGRRPAGPIPLRARLRETIRHSILDAAETVFSEHGTAHGRMEQIAARAGVSVGTLYNHFVDRRDLVEALIESRRSGLLRAVDEALAGREPGFVPRLTAFLDVIFSHIETHRRFFSLLVQEESGRPPGGLIAAAAHPSPTFAALKRRVQRLMREGLREGLLRRERPEILAALLMGMIRGLLLHELGAPPRPRPSLGGEQAASFFLEGAGRR